jgi:hypothetical protein
MASFLPWGYLYPFHPDHLRLLEWVEVKRSPRHIEWSLLNDDSLIMLCGLTLHLVLQVLDAAWFALLQVKNKHERF